MRDASNSVSPFGNHPRRIEVGIVRVATVPASKHLFVPLSALYPATAGTCEACVGWRDHTDSQAIYRRKQQYPHTKEPSGVFLPTYQPVRIFQGNASARAQRHGHRFPGFFGNDLSRRGYGALPFQPLFLMVSFAVIIAAEQRAQVRSLVAIGASHCGSGTDVAAEPAFRLLDLSEGDGHTDPRIPLAVLAEDLRRLVQCCAGQRQGTVDRSVSFGWHIEAAVTAPARGRATNHDPAIEAGSRARLLHFGAVNQFCLEIPRGMTCSGCSAVVDIRAPIRTPDELAKSCGTGEPDLFRFRKASRDTSMRATEEVRQKRKRLGFVARRIELESVGQIDRWCHTRSLTNLQQKAIPPEERRLRERATLPS